MDSQLLLAVIRGAGGVVTQHNLLSTASDEERRAALARFFDWWNGVAVLAAEATEAIGSRREERRVLENAKAMDDLAFGNLPPDLRALRTRVLAELALDDALDESSDAPSYRTVTPNQLTEAYIALFKAELGGETPDGLRDGLANWLVRYSANPATTIATRNWGGKVTSALFHALGLGIPRTKGEMLKALRVPSIPAARPHLSPPAVLSPASSVTLNRMF